MLIFNVLYHRILTGDMRVKSRYKWFLLLVCLLLALTGCNASRIDEGMYAEKAKVLDVNTQTEGEGEFVERIQSVALEIKSGSYKGTKVMTQNALATAYAYNIEVEKGDRVIVNLEELENGDIEVYIIDYSRDTQIYLLLFLFVLAILYVGRLQGFKTILTLFLTVFIIFKVHLPLLLKGYDPILITIVVATIITVVTILFISGKEKKGIAAMAGTILGVMISGGLAFAIGAKVHLTGLSNEEAVMLMYIPQGIEFNFRGLLFSGILLGALGAVMDVSMSIASAVEELNRVNSEMSWQRLYMSGMSVGRDIMGTMSNTLILAYTGSSLPLLLLLMAYDSPMNKMMNMDMIATEIIRSLAGSIGIVLTIPITAAVAVLLLKD